MSSRNQSTRQTRPRQTRHRQTRPRQTQNSIEPQRDERAQRREQERERQRQIELEQRRLRTPSETLPLLQNPPPSPPQPPPAPLPPAPPAPQDPIIEQQKEERLRNASNFRSFNAYYPITNSEFMFDPSHYTSTLASDPKYLKDVPNLQVNSFYNELYAREPLEFINKNIEDITIPGDISHSEIELRLNYSQKNDKLKKQLNHYKEVLRDHRYYHEIIWYLENVIVPSLLLFKKFLLNLTGDYVSSYSHLSSIINYDVNLDFFMEKAPTGCSLPEIIIDRDNTRLVPDIKVCLLKMIGNVSDFFSIQTKKSITGKISIEQFVVTSNRLIYLYNLILCISKDELQSPSDPSSKNYIFIILNTHGIYNKGMISVIPDISNPDSEISEIPEIHTNSNLFMMTTASCGLTTNSLTSDTISLIQNLLPESNPYIDHFPMLDTILDAYNDETFMVSHLQLKNPTLGSVLSHKINPRIHKYIDKFIGSTNADDSSFSNWAINISFITNINEVDDPNSLNNPNFNIFADPNFITYVNSKPSMTNDPKFENFYKSSTTDEIDINIKLSYLIDYLHEVLGYKNIFLIDNTCGNISDIDDRLYFPEYVKTDKDSAEYLIKNLEEFEKKHERPLTQMNIVASTISRKAMGRIRKNKKNKSVRRNKRNKTRNKSKK